MALKWHICGVNMAHINLRLHEKWHRIAGRNNSSQWSGIVVSTWLDSLPLGLFWHLSSYLWWHLLWYLFQRPPLLLYSFRAVESKDRPCDNHGQKKKNVHGGFWCIWHACFQWKYTKSVTVWKIFKNSSNLDQAESCSSNR